jgi:hypothetical protein
MSQINSVLKDFMEMRRSLHKNEPTKVEQRTAARKAKTMPTGDNDTPLEITLARIIEDKPKKKELELFFQRECDKLTKEKMKE